MQKEVYLKRMIKNLPTLRASLKLSQKDVAEKIGISRQTVVAFESGKRPLVWNTYLALVFVFLVNEKSKIIMDLFEIFNDDLVKVK